jgi:hypothetical protein
VGSPSRDHRADQRKRERQQRDPHHSGVRDLVAVEGLQDEAKEAEGEARAAQQPGDARDRPGRHPGAIVAADSCRHATLRLSTQSGKYLLRILVLGASPKST